MSSSGKEVVDLDIQEAQVADAEQVLAVTNDAFQADAFFKKEQYHNRFDMPTVLEMIQSPSSTFLIAREKNGSESASVVGSIYLHWDVAGEADNKVVTGKFSAVSVPSHFGRRGIGHALVGAVEQKVRRIAADLVGEGCTVTAKMQMGVVNVRPDLIPWYERKGYSITGELRGDPEIERITLEDMQGKVWLIWMTKELEL